MMRDMPMTVRGIVGRARIRVAEVAQLAKGSIVRLPTRADGPVEVNVGGTAFGVAEVLTKDGHYVLRLPERALAEPPAQASEEDEREERKV